MESKLTLYNTLDRRKETFEPINPPHVGMYVCGPTVYGDPHLGHARPAVTFDLLFRYLRSLGYKVRYVRNVTDVGHLEHDADDGEDKISKKARLEQLEPMEVAHYYTERYHRAMDELNVLSPSIEPCASGHFALWKKASPEHIMRWPSPWSDGFPGWHMECSAMSTKYLGQRFDIHGGGMDLMFPHHECEIAQSTAALGHDSAKYWIHNNMITINGQKMGKSLGNFITLEELFTGNHKLLTQAYSPMTIRFFVLQAHYRSTLDFSNEALQAAEKGLDRLMKAVEALDKIKPSEQSTVDPAELETRCREALDDDLNSPMAISALFDWVRIINQLVEGQQRITAADLEKLREIVRRYVFDILGLRDEKAASAGGKDLVTPLVNMLLDLRQTAKTEKNWALSDKIRDELTAIGIRVKDRKDGCDWEIE